MKSFKFKELLAVLTAILISLNVYPSYASDYEPKATMPQISQEFLDYQNGKTTFSNESSTVSGYIPEPYPLPYVNTSIDQNFPTVYGIESPTYNTETPKKFISPIKNQGQDGVCWTFAANAVLESSLLKAENLDILDTYDFSENHMKHALSYEGGNTLGFDRTHDDGGNFSQALSYWIRNKTNGPVLESDDPYIEKDSIRDVNETNSYNPSDYYVTKSVELPKLESNATSAVKENRIKEIKKAVMDYGSVATSYFSDDKYYDNPYEPTSYYNGTFTRTNHAVSIVGWNDNYSSNNFRVKPSRDGAFLIKNSWGIRGELEGYFYMSYDDNCIYSAVDAVESVNSRNFYDNIYEYDEFGRTGFTSYGVGYTNVAYANVFESKSKSEKLTAVSTFVTAPNTYFKVYVSTDGEHKNLKEVEISNAGTKTENGYRVNKYGYVTFMLKSPVNITNSKFEIAIAIYNDSVEKLYMPTESAISGYTSQAINNKKSYIVWDASLINSASWQLNENSDVCIKAFTQDASSPEYKINIANTKGGTISTNLTSAKEGSIINVTVTPDSGMALKEGSLKYNDGIDHKIENYRFEMPAKDVTVTAEFEPIKYNITAIQASGGIISIAPERAAKGETVKVTVTPDSGMQLKDRSLKYNDGTKDYIISNFEFKMIEKDITVTAEFEPIKYSINIGTSEGGKIVADKNTASAGDKIQLTVTGTSDKYRLKSGTLKCNGIEIQRDNKNVFSFEMPAESVNISAEFEKFDIEVDYSADITIKTLSEDIDLPDSKFSTIYYTTDGTDPNSSETRQEFSDGKIDFSLKNEKEELITIRAIAKREGMEDSSESSIIIAFSNGNKGIYNPQSNINYIGENVWHSQSEIEALKQVVDEVNKLLPNDSGKPEPSASQLIKVITDISKAINDFYRLKSPEILVSQSQI